MHMYMNAHITILYLTNAGSGLAQKGFGQISEYIIDKLSDITSDI